MKTIDVKGLKCPMPLIETKKALTGSNQGETLKILIDNDTSVKNVTHYLEDNNIRVETNQVGNIWELIVNRGDKNIDETQPEAYCEVPVGIDKSYVVLFAKNRIGEGSDELGEVLVEAMLESLKAQETLPQKIIFMNSGIHLVTKGSGVIPTLVELEVNGVEMISCGTCLNYYGKMEELEIGRVSNMYEILSNMRSSGKVITV